MSSTPSRSSASSTMSAPVTSLPLLLCSFTNKKPPPFGRGLCDLLRFELGRASPRLTKANKAQKEEAYEHARRLVHVLQDVRACRGPLFVFQPQIRRADLGTGRTDSLVWLPVEFVFLCPRPWARSCGMHTWSALRPANPTSCTSTCTWSTRSPRPRHSR